MTKEQTLFFNELRNIQDFVIDISLSDFEKYEKREDMLKDITYEVIYRIMELLDGYGNDLVKCDIINIKTGNIINKDIEMHDMCATFIDHANI